MNCRHRKREDLPSITKARRALESYTDSADVLVTRVHLTIAVPVALFVREIHSFGFRSSEFAKAIFRAACFRKMMSV